MLEPRYCELLAYRLPCRSVSADTQLPFCEAQALYDRAVALDGCRWSARQLAFSVVALCTADPSSVSSVEDMTPVATRYTSEALRAVVDNDAEDARDQHASLLCFLVRALLRLRVNGADAEDAEIMRLLGHTNLARADAFSAGALRVLDELSRDRRRMTTNTLHGMTLRLV